MSAYSKTFLAFPDGFIQADSQTICLADPTIPFVSSAPNPQASYVAANQSGWYRGIPRIVLSGNTAIQVAPLIPCLGYEEVYLMPVSASGQTHDLSLYAIYGDYSSGGEATRWLVQYLYGTGTMATSATKLEMPSPAGTAYKTYSGLGTAVTAFSAALDGVIGCTTTAVAGSATVPQVYAFPHLGGADYLAICAASPAASTDTFNCYVRLG
jgi:hypothetical protein